MAQLDLTKPDGWLSKTLGLFGLQIGRRETGLQPTMSSFPIGKAGTVAVTPDTAMGLTTVYACTRIIATSVAAMPMNISSVSKRGVKKLDLDHKLNDVFNFKPNSHQTPFDFWVTVIINLLLWGNAYVKISKSNGEVSTLWPLMSAQMKVELLPNNTKRYVYSNENGKEVTYGEDQIWHLRHMSSNAIVGLPIIETARDTLAVALAEEQRVLHLAQNGFKQSGVLMLDHVLTDEQRTNIRREFKDIQEGNTDVLRVLEAGMSFTPTSQTVRDSQLIEGRRFQVEEIARAFGVPPPMIGDTSATTAWGSGIYEINQGFYKLTLRPLTESIEASIKAFVVGRPRRKSLVVEFDFSSFTEGTDEQKLAMFGKAVKDGLMTPNEARALMGWPKIAGADTLFLQAQMTPIEDLKKLAEKKTEPTTTPTPPPTPPDDPNADPNADPGEPEDDAESEETDDEETTD